MMDPTSERCGEPHPSGNLGVGCGLPQRIPTGGFLVGQGPTLPGSETQGGALPHRYLPDS